MFKLSTKDPAVMLGAAINSELDKLDDIDADLCNRLIEDGRGYETRNEVIAKSDPLSVLVKNASIRRWDLRHEMERRYGPKCPNRLPKGFGPIKQYC